MPRYGLAVTYRHPAQVHTALTLPEPNGALGGITEYRSPSSQINRILNSQQKLLCYYEMTQTAIGFSLRVTLKVAALCT